jgi:hypothetical protein
MFRTKDTYGKYKYSGRSKALVIDNRDPANKGRIQVRHPILGETVWIDYLRGPGQFDVPSIGDVVYIECDTGQHEFPVAHGNLTLGYPGQANLPEAFKSRNVPTNRGMFTPGGHLFEMDDGLSNPTNSPSDKDLTTENRGIRLTSKAGYKIHIQEDSENNQQHILIEAIDGSFIKIDVSNGSMDINSAGNYNLVVGEDTKMISEGNHEITCSDLTVNADSALIDTSGNTVISAQGQAQLVGSSGTDVGDSGSVTKVDGSQVLLAGGAVPMLLATAQFVGIDNMGAPVISSIMSGQATKVLGT